ncbi:MAG: DUF542 domain-containing protein [Thermomicrobiales bacterium]|nr:DUF542 domain-containing protein [Thermomicrobiales bacterium]
MSNQTVSRLPLDSDALLAMTIRDIIDREPRALEVLAPYGFDLCCGGGHPLGEALALHNVAHEVVLPKLASLSGAEA